MSVAKEKTQKQATLESKRERRPVNGMVTRMDVRGKEPGYHYIWVNDDKVDIYLEGGYEFVRHAVTVGSKRIDTTSLTMESQIWKNVGRGVKAFLMRIPDELHTEDVAAEQKTADEQIRARLGEINSDGLSEINVSTSVGKR